MNRKPPSKTVTEALNKMYANMARAAARKAVELAGKADDTFTMDYQQQAELIAGKAEHFAMRAGGNALRWGL